MKNVISGDIDTEGQELRDWLKGECGLYCSREGFDKEPDEEAKRLSTRERKNES